MKYKFIAAVGGLNDERSPIEVKRIPTTKHLAKMNETIAEWLSPEYSPIQIKKAVYAAAKVLSSTDRRINYINDLRRKQQLDHKIEEARQCAFQL